MDDGNERTARAGSDGKEKEREETWSKSLNQFNDNDQLSVGLFSSIGGALNRYNRGEGLESRTRLNFFRISFLSCKVAPIILR